MRVTLCLVGGLIAAMACLPLAAAAPIYRYCAAYEERGDMTCAYDTFPQCLDTARGGAGGMCMENPAWHPALAAPVREKAKRRKY